VRVNVFVTAAEAVKVTFVPFCKIKYGKQLVVPLPFMFEPPSV
jgi:hypothetical protein